MTIVTDTGPLLHLHWVGALEWALPPQEIVVMEAVWREVGHHAPEALQDMRLRRTADVQVSHLLGMATGSERGSGAQLRS